MKKDLRGSVVLSRMTGGYAPPVAAMGADLLFQGIANKFVRNKEHHHAKTDVEKLLENKSALSYQHTTAFAYFVAAVCGMPYLFAFQHIKNIVLARPQVSEFVFHQPGSGQVKMVISESPHESCRQYCG